MMCTKLGTERPTSHLSLGRASSTVAILVAIFGEKVARKLHLHAKILCAKVGYEITNGLGEIG